MSGTELGRLMDEVTAQPHGRRRLRRSGRAGAPQQTRLRASANGASVAALAVIIAVRSRRWAAHFGAPRPDAGRPAPRPRVRGNALGWTQHSKDGISWQYPPGVAVTTRPIPTTAAPKALIERPVHRHSARCP